MRGSKRINLLTPDLKRPPAVTVDALLLGFSFVIIGSVLALALLKVQSKRELQKSVAIKEGELKNLEVTLASTAPQPQNDQANSHIRWIEEMKSQQVKWSESFKELSLLIPQESWLIYLKFSNESGKIDTAIRGETSSQLKIASFYDGLKNSYYYREIVLKSSDLLPTFQPPLFRFSFETLAKKEAPSSNPSKNSTNNEKSSPAKVAKK